MEEESRGIFARMEDESAALTEKIQSQSKVIGKSPFPTRIFFLKYINFEIKGVLDRLETENEARQREARELQEQMERDQARKY